MDLSQKIKQIAQEDKELEIKNKQILELSAKKYHLQKDLREINMKLSVKRGELQTLQREVSKLESEFIVLEKQHEITKESLYELVKKVVEYETKTENIQVQYWNKIKDFVTKANHHFQKEEQSRLDIERKAQISENKKIKEKMEKEKRFQQLKLEGEVAAGRLFLKYQAEKIEELRTIHEMLKQEKI